MLSAQFLMHQQIQRHQWDDFVETSSQGALYARSWFLDAVMSGWGAVVVSESDRWQAVMPICIRYKYGIGYALQPSFSQYLGVIFAPFTGKSNKILHKKREILHVLISSLPKRVRLFSYNFSPNFDYFLPFLRHGFDIQPRMNLSLSLDRPLEQIVGAFSTSIRNHLNKAKKHDLTCRLGSNIGVLSERMLSYKFIKSVQEQQALESIWKASIHVNKGFLLEVIGPDLHIHCSGLFIIEKEKVVFVASAVDRDKRQMGSNSFLMLEAIKKFKYMGIKELDLKGSMIPGIEQFFMGFNPAPVTYYNISRNRLRYIENIFYQLLRSD